MTVSRQSELVLNRYIDMLRMRRRSGTVRR
ncbi:MAG: hypothetical protein JWN35_1740 [Frankiales bacterium]|nr:hypothetical protein [Frankiales bacterium]